MSPDTLFQVLDRYGFPTFALCAVVWCAVLMIKGPMNTFAGALAGKIGKLVDTMIDFLARAGATLGALPGQVAAEGQATRSAIAAEGAAIREHVTAAAEGVRDRVSQAENEVVNALALVAVAGASSRASVQVLEPTSAPVGPPLLPSATAAPSAGPPTLPVPEARAALPTQPDRPRPPLPTLPSAAPPAAEPMPA